MTEILIVPLHRSRIRGRKQTVFVEIQDFGLLSPSRL